MQKEKVFGVSLIFLGLLIIFWGVFASFNIFTAKKEPPAVFQTVIKEIASEEKVVKDESQIIEEMMKEQIKEMLPSNFMPKTLNLVSWSMFMFILFLAGGKISGIGIDILKKER